MYINIKWIVKVDLDQLKLLHHSLLLSTKFVCNIQTY